MKNNLLYLLLVLIVATGCGRKLAPTAANNDDVILTGEVTRSQIFNAPGYSWMNSGYPEYNPNDNAVQYLASAEDEVQYLVYFGTWCPDTQRELPKFFKIMDEARISKDNIQLYAVNEEKQGAPGISENNISYVPTFIVKMNGKEIGRVTENPEQTLEQDFADMILSAKVKR